MAGKIKDAWLKRFVVAAKDAEKEFSKKIRQSDFNVLSTYEVDEMEVVLTTHFSNMDPEDILLESSISEDYVHKGNYMDIANNLAKEINPGRMISQHLCHKVLSSFIDELNQPFLELIESPISTGLKPIVLPDYLREKLEKMVSRDQLTQRVDGVIDSVFFKFEDEYRFKINDHLMDKKKISERVYASGLSIDSDPNIEVENESEDQNELKIVSDLDMIRYILEHLPIISMAYIRLKQAEINELIRNCLMNYYHKLRSALNSIATESESFGDDVHRIIYHAIEQSPEEYLDIAEEQRKINSLHQLQLLVSDTSSAHVAIPISSSEKAE